jgi:tRNA modification GTPase
MARAVPRESSGDTIVARATAAGDAAIAIVRVSGAGAHPIAGALFVADRPGAPPEVGRMVLGRLRDGASGVDLDRVLAVRWQAPHSYTGEDMIEFHLHGSSVLAEAVVSACQRAGARLARAGEFTRRAYLNGKLDLAQAEAVCDLIRARTEAAGRAALAQLNGGLSRRLEAVRARLVPVVAELEAHVDFPEEGLEFSTRSRLGAVVDSAIVELQELVAGARRGRFLREGARVVLAGPPNAGKSSLFNLLLRRERALVTPHPGTTRDALEAQVDLAGVPVTLVDTAGLRAHPEPIESMGIARAREEVLGADVVVFLIDASSAASAPEDYARLRELPHLVVANKVDLLGEEGRAGLERLAAQFSGSGRRAFVGLSVTARTGFEVFEEALARELTAAGLHESGSLVTNRRHATALEGALAGLQTAAEGLASELSPEFIVVDLTEAIAGIDAVTGREGLDEEVLDAIFSTFCLGK